MKSKPRKLDEELDDIDDLDDDDCGCAAIDLAEFREEKQRIVGLFSSVSAQTASNVVGALLSMLSVEKNRINSLPEDVPAEDLARLIKPIEFFVSTEGGTAEDMYSMIDVMNHVLKEGCPIHTIGVGKVKSAGILLLASGTKGERCAGKHCRFMLHSVGGGTSGLLHDIETDVRELKWIQDRYIDIMLETTTLTKRQLRKVFNSNSNHFFDANKAIEYGIIDKIY